MTRKEASPAAEKRNLTRILLDMITVTLGHPPSHPVNRNWSPDRYLFNQIDNLPGKSASEKLNQLLEILDSNSQQAVHLRHFGLTKRAVRATEFLHYPDQTDDILIASLRKCLKPTAAGAITLLRNQAVEPLNQLMPKNRETASALVCHLSELIDNCADKTPDTEVAALLTYDQDSHTYALQISDSETYEPEILDKIIANLNQPEPYTILELKQGAAAENVGNMGIRTARKFFRAIGGELTYEKSWLNGIIAKATWTESGFITPEPIQMPDLFEFNRNIVPMISDLQ